MANQNAGEAPHFTKELLAGSLRHLRGDLEASLTGEAADDRARSRLKAARRMGLDKLAKDAIGVMEKAEHDVHDLIWPGGLDARYLALAGVVETLAALSTRLLPHDAEHAHVTGLEDIIAEIRLACGSLMRMKIADSVHEKLASVSAQPGSADALKTALEDGATAVLLQRDGVPDAAYASAARKALLACYPTNVSLILEGRPDIARVTDASGVLLAPGDVWVSDARKVLNPWQAVGVTEGSPDAEGADFVY